MKRSQHGGSGRSCVRRTSGGWLPTVLTVLLAVLLPAMRIVRGTAHVAAQGPRLQVVGRLDTPGTTTDVDAIGPLAYVADYLNGLLIVDVSSPAMPRVIGELDADAVGVQVVGDRAYLADVGGLQIVDVGDPHAPRALGRVLKPGDTDGVNHIAVAGSYAYLTDYDWGLMIADVSNPLAPQITGHLDTPGDASGVATDGSHVFIADTEGLQIVDVSDPRSPRQVGRLSAQDSPYSVALNGSTAYLTTGREGLVSIDVSDPLRPRARARVGADFLDVVARDWMVYVSNNNGIFAVDASDPGAPRIVASVDTPGRAQEFDVDGAHAYVADDEWGMTVVQLAAPTSVPPVMPTRPPSPMNVYFPVALRDPGCPPVDRFADVVLVIDASTSMNRRDPNGRTKLAIALDAVRTMLDQPGGFRLQRGGVGSGVCCDQVGVVAFNEQSYLLQPLTSDRSLLEQALTRMETAEKSRVELGVFEGMVELLGSRHRADHSRAMIVLSDGMANPVPGQAAIDAARRAQSEGITVFVVGIGPEMRTDVLASMASPDRFWPAPEASMLAAIYRQLAVRVVCPSDIYWGRR